MDLTCGYISYIFTRPKKDRGHGIIQNLKPFDNDIKHIHFKMDILKSAINLLKKKIVTLQQLTWRMLIIPSQSTLQIENIYKSSEKKSFFQFTSLPMGLSSAPRIFTKIIKPVFSHLRKLWYSIIAYIDDCLLQGDTCESCLRNVDQTVEILDSSPFKVSFSTIKTNSVFFGFILDSEKMNVSLTQDLRKWLWVWHNCEFDTGSEKMTVNLTQEKANDVIQCC